MSHECLICMQVCFCDMEDHDNPTPADCCHECAEGDGEDDEIYYDEMPYLLPQPTTTGAA